MKKLLLLISSCIGLVPSIIACTTFFINHDGHLVFGRNYDWVSDAGMLATNLRGLNKTSVKTGDGNTINWTSRYGSLTFNQFGKEFPTGGMNEKGLVVELMWADGIQYPEADNRPALGVLQWIQYQLDNHATIEEVIASEKNIRISQNNPPLHYLVADADGNAATIEFFKGKSVVHKGNSLPYPVLTNTAYSQSAKVAGDANIAGGNTSFSFQDNSVQRFAKACSMVQQLQQKQTTKPVADYAFDILENVSQQGFTKWSIVYDLKNKTIRFKTALYKNIKTVSFDAFNFDCTSQPMAINLNQAMNGVISNSFVPFTEALNRSILDKAVVESKSVIQISDQSKNESIAYAKSIICK